MAKAKKAKKAQDPQQRLRGIIKRCMVKGEKIVDAFLREQEMREKQDKACAKGFGKLHRGRIAPVLGGYDSEKWAKEAEREAIARARDESIAKAGDALAVIAENYAKQTEMLTRAMALCEQFAAKAMQRFEQDGGL